MASICACFRDSPSQESYKLNIVVFWAIKISKKTATKSAESSGNLQSCFDKLNGSTKRFYVVDRGKRRWFRMVGGGGRGSGAVRTRDRVRRAAQLRVLGLLLHDLVNERGSTRIPPQAAPVVQVPAELLLQSVQLIPKLFVVTVQLLVLRPKFGRFLVQHGYPLQLS